MTEVMDTVFESVGAVAWDLASRHGHWWAGVVSRENAAAMTPSQLVEAAKAAAANAEEGDWGGVMPEVDVDGTLVHTTGTGRLTWRIRAISYAPGGGVELSVTAHRPVMATRVVVKDGEALDDDWTRPQGDSEVTGVVIAVPCPGTNGLPRFEGWVGERCRLRHLDAIHTVLCAVGAWDSDWEDHGTAVMPLMKALIAKVTADDKDREYGLVVDEDGFVTTVPVAAAE